MIGTKETLFIILPRLEERLYPWMPRVSDIIDKIRARH